MISKLRSSRWAQFQKIPTPKIISQPNNARKNNSRKAPKSSTPFTNKINS